MPNPKRKHTRSRRDSRRSQNWRLDKTAAGTCPNCKNLKPSHTVCPSCGWYNGKLVIAQKKKEKAAEGEGGQQEQK